MIAIGTRFWDARENPSTEKIEEFVKQVSQYGDLVIVAINVDEDKSGALEILKKYNLPNLLVFPVTPWRFTSVLNSLVYRADSLQQNFLLVHSAEIFINSDVVDQLRERIDNETLVVGARLPQHEFYSDREKVTGTGKTVPWNTCCLWNLSLLARTGFPLIGDASFDPPMAGGEELSLIALQQALYPEHSKTILMEMSGIEWKTEFTNDSVRRTKHERKLNTKGKRSALQLGMLGLKEPWVQHEKIS